MEFYHIFGGQSEVPTEDNFSDSQDTILCVVLCHSEQNSVCFENDNNSSRKGQFHSMGDRAEAA